MTKEKKINFIKLFEPDLPICYHFYYGKGDTNFRRLLIDCIGPKAYYITPKDQGKASKTLDTIYHTILNGGKVKVDRYEILVQGEDEQWTQC